MANKRNEYPDWVEKHRKKGVTIRKTKYGYGLYKCTSIYVKGGKNPKSVQEFLGMVYEDKGFVPKSEKKEYRKPFYVEYGLSSFILLNFKRTLDRASYDRNQNIIRLGIIKYIFGSCDQRLLDMSFIARNDEKLKEYAGKANGKRIDTISASIDKAFKERITDKDDLSVLVNELKLCVCDAANDVFPVMSEELKDLIERYGLKSW